MEFEDGKIRVIDDYSFNLGKEIAIEKGCVFLKNYRQDTPDGTGYIAGIVNDKTIEDFREFMQE